MKKVKFSDICIKIGSGATPKGGEQSYCDGGISLIRSQNILDYKFSSDGLAHINRIQAEKLQNVEVLENDILLNITGDSVARSCIVDKYYLPARVNQHVAIIRADITKVMPSYLFYYLQLNKKYLLQLAASGATRKALTKGMIENIEINLPSLDEQQKITIILDAIQRKININGKINDNLLELLQTIYKKYFKRIEVDASYRLSDICIYSKTKVPASKYNLNTYYSTENILPQKAGVTQSSKLPKGTKVTACHKGDTLISNIRPYFKKIFYCHEDCGCSNDVLCFSPKEPLYSTYLFSTLYSDNFFYYVVSGAKGTKMPRGDKEQIMDYPIEIPPSNQLREFNIVAVPLLEKVKIINDEKKSLKILRNTLLPKLMSGELDVSNIVL